LASFEDLGLKIKYLRARVLYIPKFSGSQWRRPSMSQISHFFPDLTSYQAGHSFENWKLSVFDKNKLRNVNLGLTAIT